MRRSVSSLDNHSLVRPPVTWPTIAWPTIAWLAALSVTTPVWRALPAQGPGQIRITVRTRPNTCEELASSPTALARAPEGLALLRLKRELDGAAQTLERNQQLQPDQVRQLSIVQRGVDSAMQIVVRYFDRNGAPDEVVMLRRGDSTRVTAQGRSIDARGLFAAMDSSMQQLVPALSRSPMGIDEMVRSLQPQVAALSGAAEAHLAAAMASGYLGFSLSGAQVRVVTPDGVMTSYCEYPLVEAVDAGSPAERAGLAAGDTVMAYNGRDVTQEAVNYPQLLTPGSVVRVRVSRSGRQREVPVTVSPRTDAPRSDLSRPGSPLAGERSFMLFRTPGAAGTPPSAAGGGFNALTFTGGGTMAMIGGAQFTAIDQEFAATLELPPGVLVLRVIPGTPASEAGLLAGEVVVRVNSTPVRDVVQLRNLMTPTGAGTVVQLTVQSRAGTRVVKWSMN